MLSMVDRGVAKASKEDKIDAKRDGEVTLSGSMTRQVRLRYSEWILFVFNCPRLGRARPNVTRPELAHYEHRSYNRGYGD